MKVRDNGHYCPICAEPIPGNWPGCVAHSLSVPDLEDQVLHYVRLLAKQEVRERYIPYDVDVLRDTLVIAACEAGEKGDLKEAIRRYFSSSGDLYMALLRVAEAMELDFSKETLMYVAGWLVPGGSML